MSVFLETERLKLHYFTEADRDRLLELDSDREVMRYINGGTPNDLDAIDKTLAKFLDYYQNYQHFGFWATHEKSTDEFIGWFHFFPAVNHAFGVESNLVRENEIVLGYRLRQSSWGKGYATEGARSLIVKGFTEWGVERIIAWALLANKGSIRVMEKAGLKFECEYQLKPNQLPGLQQLNERIIVKYGCDRDEHKDR